MEKFYIQITAGRGPVECASVVYKVHKLLMNSIWTLKDKGYTVEDSLVDFNEYEDKDGRYGPLAYECFMSITMEIRYNDITVLETLRKDWEGTIKWVATRNYFRPNHKRKNWFVGVKFIEVPEWIDVNDKDIVITSMRASGPGGQNVNKVESAIRAVHIPTGVFVVVQDSRDQSKNRKIAKERLMDKLTLINKYKEDVFKAENWSEHTSLQRGGEIRTIKGYL